VRVGQLLGRLLALVAVIAGSVAAAILLLNSASSSSEQAQPAAPAGKVRVEAEGDSTHRSDGGAREGLLEGDATGSWESLAQSTPARLGLALAPLGGGGMHRFGSLQTGHAWSTIKVPILVTLMRQHGERDLSAEEEDWAHEALTASDNEAAAALFGRLEDSQGGLQGASSAVDRTLRRAGDASTVVATAPPPPGAVSTFGQTEWSLASSAVFLRALARGRLLDQADTARVLGLMEEVIPEQRWGLGEAGFPATWNVAMKGGWGPEGSASGPYLVRQSGVVRHGGTGVAVAMIALADSGSFEAGVEALGQEAVWLREHLAPTA
jgi:beta-lactamase class A